MAPSGETPWQKAIGPSKRPGERESSRSALRTEELSAGGFGSANGNGRKVGSSSRRAIAGRSEGCWSERLAGPGGRQAGLEAAEPGGPLPHARDPMVAREEDRRR